jgi:hypothetical protein
MVAVLESQWSLLDEPRLVSGVGSWHNMNRHRRGL